MRNELVRCDTLLTVQKNAHQGQILRSLKKYIKFLGQYG